MAHPVGDPSATPNPTTQGDATLASDDEEDTVVSITVELGGFYDGDERGPFNN
jgi:hypothetical protein